jgi:hypothetical protein
MGQDTLTVKGSDTFTNITNYKSQWGPHACTSREVMLLLHRLT